MSVTPSAVTAIFTKEQPSAKFTFSLKDTGGTALNAGTTVAAALTDNAGKTAGTASASNTVAGGASTVTLTITSPEKNLTLTLTPGTGAAETVTVTSYSLTSLGLIAVPGQLALDGSAIDFNAEAVSTNGQALVIDNDLEVYFEKTLNNDDEVVDQFFPTGNDLPATTAGSGSTTVTKTTAPVGQTFVQENQIYPPLELQATLRAGAADKRQLNPISTTGSAVITQLVPPKVDIPGAPTILTQDDFDSGIIRYWIPRVGNAAPGDSITLRIQSEKTGASVIFSGPTIGQADLTKNHVISTKSTSSIYQQMADELTVTYIVMREDDDPGVYYESQDLVVTTSRTQLDDNNVDFDLRPPIPSEYLYSFTDANKQTTLSVQVRFDGQYKPATYDRITLHLDLTGITVANMGQVHNLGGYQYSLKSSDATLGHALVVNFPDDILPTGGFTSDVLSDTNRSDGVLYYTVESSHNGIDFSPARKSPSTSVVVDTIPPNSGGGAARIPLLDRLKYVLQHKRG